MRISDWSSDVCSSDLASEAENARRLATRFLGEGGEVINRLAVTAPNQVNLRVRIAEVSREVTNQFGLNWDVFVDGGFQFGLQSLPQVAGVNSLFASGDIRSEEHTTELQSLMRISYAVFCLKKKQIQ